ncbi:carbamate kinase [uncultured Brevundimonas sp.]|uniref:carbamate kinase n=1 Tax=uncultured Brevundimonas sp. TaxID=213418 RepID=UPI0030EFA1EB|tara:strand:- start:16282 stop:17223 length:942 start_codon:yes stop_codon:yes gene_type:complete
MRIVVALGGNALLQRGEPLTSENQRANIAIAARALAPLADHHELIISHGNGPQVGLLALQGAAYKPEEAFPLDVLGAETEGMIGYMIEQELGNLLPKEKSLATILTMIEVDPADPAFADPSKFVGPVYVKEEAQRLTREKGWTVKQDGKHWRRVVASPLPKRIFEIQPIRWLMERGVLVICTGGGGIPTAFDDHGLLHGVEAVIDKDYASEFLARELDADLLVMVTDVPAVFVDWGMPTQRAIRSASPDLFTRYSFAAGSMGPKVAAACQFVAVTGRKAAIGALADLASIIEGQAGTTIMGDVQEIEWALPEK